MFYEEFGNSKNPVLVFLHGANMVDSFFKQYSLQNKYHIILPHITGYGKESGTVFTTEKAVEDLYNLIKSFNQKVYLVGFSLGAQLGFVLLSRHQELFKSAIIISPWIIKEPQFTGKVKEQNIKMFGMIKKKWYVKLQGRMLGYPDDLKQKLIEDTMNLQKDTLANSVDNGITFELCPEFKDVKVPVLALCGSKEYPVVSDSVKEMASVNSMCKYQIVNKAAHNIPTNFSTFLLEKIEEMMPPNNKEENNETFTQNA